MAAPFEFCAVTAAESATARRALQQKLEAAGRDNVDEALLVFSELVTNALRHAGGAHRILVSDEQGLLCLAVYDRSRAIPVIREVGGKHGGFGMQIVSQLSVRWGCDLLPEGKVVWSELACAHGLSVGRCVP
jgi:serine/threonine-protein kinase RsbW